MSIEKANFVVQRGSDQFRCTGEELQDKLQDGDLMVLTRPGDKTYQWVITDNP